MTGLLEQIAGIFLFFLGASALVGLAFGVMNGAKNFLVGIVMFIIALALILSSLYLWGIIG